MSVEARATKRDPSLVQILLSTYNGARFLREQIDSIIAQDHREIQILIRDDGSTDGTLEVLQGYLHIPGISVVSGPNIGAARSFFELIELSSPEADYVALCDQDDVWLPNKISRALETLRSLSPDTPGIYAGRLTIVDEQLQPLGLSGLPRRPPTFGNALVETVLTGCTMIFNRAARSLLAGKLPSYAVMHDTWIYLVMAAFGDIRFDPQPMILYRQHGANTIGVGPPGLRFWLWRTQKFLKRTGGYTEQVAEFERLYGDRLSVEQKKLVELVMEARTSLSSRVRLALTRTVFRQAPMNDFLLRLVILANRL